MPKQAKNNPVPQSKNQSKATVDRDRANVRELKGIFARANDDTPAEGDPRRTGTGGA